MSSIITNEVQTKNALGEWIENAIKDEFIEYYEYNVFKCWDNDPDKRPDIQKVFGRLSAMSEKKEHLLEEIPVTTNNDIDVTLAHSNSMNSNNLSLLLKFDQLVEGYDEDSESKGNEKQEPTNEGSYDLNSADNSTENNENYDEDSESNGNEKQEPNNEGSYDLNSSDNSTANNENEKQEPTNEGSYDLNSSDDSTENNENEHDLASLSDELYDYLFDQIDDEYEDLVEEITNIANKLFRKSIKKDDALSMYFLANSYESAWDQDQAMFWYKKAAKNGSPEAKERLYELYETLFA
ncbi:4572_t:CDS:2 [Funneliformis caledonium]|uniref:4572_t:CDS:1 n=1 Tax=Funneliformis caledonium TaxID=1117310 RepID=A0A9N9ACC0_9GLOM|nr:4572_t:CDS:2 [Funneliformis caledonium]